LGEVEKHQLKALISDLLEGGACLLVWTRKHKV